VAVLREKKVLGLEGLDGGVQSVVVEQNGSEDGALSVEVAREGAFELRIDRHGAQKRLWRASLLIRLSFLSNSTFSVI
jgi:hypothetical protein